MPELSADCLNAWVAYTHTPYCTTYVSTAVILRPTRIETSHPRFKSGSSITSDECEWNQHSQIGPMISLWRCQAQEKLTNSQHEAIKFNVELPTVRQARHLPLIVFQLLIRCRVHPWAMRHPRTWSAVDRSLTVVSSSDCISACIIVSMIIVDGLVDKHREQVFPKDEFIESMIS